MSPVAKNRAILVLASPLIFVASLAAGGAEGVRAFGAFFRGAWHAFGRTPLVDRREPCRAEDFKPADYGVEPPHLDLVEADGAARGGRVRGIAEGGGG